MGGAKGKGAAAAHQRERDQHYMARCLVLARRGQGRTAPNPMVGCVIVDRHDKIIAEGWHKRIGAAHAEAMALAELGGRAPGCTMYVNLEPCAHKKNRRTEPCAPRVFDAGLGRLVVGMGDPIRSHAGGAAWLRRQGVEVVLGVLRAECAELNRAFITWARERRPYFVLKAGMTLDGKVATRTGESQWITGPAARREVHELRDQVDGILVGVGTVRADDPKLTTRGVRAGRDAVRIVLDSQLRSSPASAFLPAKSSSKARVIVAATAAASHRRFQRLTAAGAEVWRLPSRGERVDLRKLAARLADEGLAHVLVEGGPTVHSAFVTSDLADELLLYVAPMAFGGGGQGGPAWLGGTGVARLASASRFRFTEPGRVVGGDIALRLRRPRAAGRRS